jgi:acetyl-CoA carboxylase biotin carboxyl carrier protein
MSYKFAQLSYDFACKLARTWVASRHPEAKRFSVTALITAEVEQMIRLFEASDWQRLALQNADSELLLHKNGAPQPSGAPARIEVDDPLGQSQPAAASRLITAPSLGTFHRGRHPGAVALVECGQEVSAETELGTIEVLRRFTPLRAGVAGRIIEVCMRDGALVEFAQPLFLIDTHD